ncbi:trace amine-associated receptor 9-like [Daphnia pulicaria]|uniref:trace amine-associated receptor 9-like n=1 Tax=Daphnia pulicaria TaxID=35523 RepID=UPI001EECD863|nr:trace amine-associated receptor 9-like [Daphnia pulicaria]
MVLLMYSPTVYNQSCQWSSLHGSGKSAISNSSTLLLSSTPSSTAQSHDWGLALATGSSLSGYDLFRCAVVLVVTCGLISGNLILALAVNCKYSAGILQFQTRCLLTSIATNHVATGLLVTVWNIYPSLIGCWPYGVLLCQIQAVLLGSLSQHSSILWILVALDRYIFATRRHRYLQLASSKLCVWVAGTTWGLSFAYYTCMVLPYKAFDYSNDGLAGCAPVPQTGVLMLVSTCLLYFPTTMTLLYVYGTVFHSHNSSQRLVPTTTRTLPVAAAGGQSLVKTATRYECNDHCTEGYCNVKVEEAVTRSVATMSLAFIINSTPWIIKQIIVACLGNEVAPWLDFVITWSSLSMGIWNPLLCWLLCPPIRDGVRHILSLACACCYTNNYSQPTRRSSTWATEISTVNGLAAPPCEIHPNVGSTFMNVIKPHPNSPATGPTTPIRGIQHLPQIFLPPPPSSVINAAVQVVASPCCSPGRSVGTVEHDERIWGEILERSLSSNSLHHLHRLHRNHDDEDDDDGNRSSRVVDSARTPAAASYQQEKRRNGKPPGNWHV